MADGPDHGFDLDRSLLRRVDGDEDSGDDTYLQALAVLIDADLSEGQRAEALAAVLTEFLGQLAADQRDRFERIAELEGPASAMSWVSTVCRPSHDPTER